MFNNIPYGLYRNYSFTLQVHNANIISNAEIRQAGQDKVGVMVVPIAFVSEHSETLVELDLEYRELALQSGVPHYVRIPTVQADLEFINGLAGLVNSNQSCGSGACWCGALSSKA